MTPENQTNKGKNQLLLSALDSAKNLLSILVSHHIHPSTFISSLPFILAEIFTESEVSEQFKTEFWESLPKSVEFVIQLHELSISEKT